MLWAHPIRDAVGVEAQHLLRIPGCLESEERYLGRVGGEAAGTERLSELGTGQARGHLQAGVDSPRKGTAGWPFFIARKAKLTRQSCADGFCSFGARRKARTLSHRRPRAAASHPSGSSHRAAPSPRLRWALELKGPPQLSQGCGV